VSRKPLETDGTGKQLKRSKAGAATEPPDSVKPIVRKTKDHGGVTVTNIAQPPISAADADYRGPSSMPKPGGKDPRRLPMATSASPAVNKVNWRTSIRDDNEVRSAVGQLNDEDRRGFRSRCRRILSAPGKFTRNHVEICTAASFESSMQ
jgi:hypothetical protein